MCRNTQIAGLALWAGLLAGQSAEAQIADRSTVRVRLTDLADVSAGTLRHAKAEAIAIFERSQISLEWIDAEACDPRCLYVRIIAKPIGKESDDQSVVGIAPGTPEARGRFAWVFYDRICSYSADLGLDASQMLGHVIAHELGHLLLPHDAHSLAGIMRPAWDRAQVNGVTKGALTFTPEQAALIRHRLSASASPHCTCSMTSHGPFPPLFPPFPPPCPRPVFAGHGRRSTWAAIPDCWIGAVRGTDSGTRRRCPDTREPHRPRAGHGRCGSPGGYPVQGEIGGNPSVRARRYHLDLA